MTEALRTELNDNGVVDISGELILAGVSPCKPEDLCTKYREECTPLQVSPDTCGTKCCIEGGS